MKILLFNKGKLVSSYQVISSSSMLSSNRFSLSLSFAYFDICASTRTSFPDSPAPTCVTKSSAYAEIIVDVSLAVLASFATASCWCPDAFYYPSNLLWDIPCSVLVKLHRRLMEHVPLLLMLMVTMGGDIYGLAICNSPLISHLLHFCYI